MRRLASGLVLLASSAAAQVPTNGDGIPPQIIPRFHELGMPSFSVGAAPVGGGLSAPSPDMQSPVTSGSSDAVTAMMATDYGSAAMDAAQQAGISSTSLASIGQAESGFRNVPTANGSSSATGPWQVTAPTWQSTVAAHDLGYSAADRTNPAANAVVAAYVIRDYASTISNATGQPATTLDAYGAYVYGPNAGIQIATSDPSTPLSAIVSQQALSNNGMSSWSVGDFRSRFSSKFGSSANQPVLTSS